MEDLASASDGFWFSNDNELYTDVRKRVLTSRIMQATQRTVGGRRGFGYPFSLPSLYWGPRVNYAARNYWTPATPDSYSARRDPVRRRQIRRMPRSRRHSVYGDQPAGYRFALNAAGKADPFRAIIALFARQPRHKRSLIHCDYLMSLVHFRVFAETIGRTEFNRRARAFIRGRRNIVLRHNLFSDLEVPLRMRSAGRTMASIRLVRPSSEGDLVIGDHVYLFNHRAYDLINRNIGNAWRLENAVLIDRRGRRNTFLGHGSGRKTAGQMRAKLATEYNDVVNIAMRIIRRTQRGSATSRTTARTEMARRFPNIRRVGGRWRVIGRLTLFGSSSGGAGGTYNVPLRRIRSNEVIGLKDPANPSLMNPVRRPAESA